MKTCLNVLPFLACSDAILGFFVCLFFVGEGCLFVFFCFKVELTWGKTSYGGIDFLLVVFLVDVLLFQPGQRQRTAESSEFQGKLENTLPTTFLRNLL